MDRVLPPIGSKLMVAAKKGSSIPYQVILRELLASAGAPDASDPGEPCSKRLSCFLLLFKQLLATSAFGPLQEVMQHMLQELQTCLYSKQLASSSLPAVTGADLDFHRIPYFALHRGLQQELMELREEVAKLRPRAAAATALEERLAREQARHEKEVTRLQDRARQLREEVGRQSAEVLRLGHRLQDQGSSQAKLQMQLQEKHQALQKEAARLQRQLAHFQAQNALPVPFSSVKAMADPKQEAGEAEHLLQQLLTLLAVRLNDFEAAHEEAEAEGEAVPSGFDEELQGLESLLHSLRKVVLQHRQQEGDGDPRRAGGHAPAVMLTPQELLQAPDRPRPAADNSGGDDAASAAPVVDYTDAIWRTFLKTCGTKALALLRMQPPRRLSEHRLICLMDWFLSRKRLFGPGHKQPASSFFFSWLEETYHAHLAAMMTAQGVLWSVQQMRDDSPIVALLGLVLDGSADEALWKYYLELRDMVTRQPGMMLTRDVQRLLLALYSDSASPDDLAQLLSKWNNAELMISRTNVLTWLVGMVLERSEPRLCRWIRVLEMQCGRRRGLSKGLFVDTCSKVFHSVEDPTVFAAHFDVAMMHQLQHPSVDDSHTEYEGCVGIVQAAHILCLLDLEALHARLDRQATQKTRGGGTRAGANPSALHESSPRRASVHPE